MSNVSGDQFDKEKGIEHEVHELPRTIWYVDHAIVDVSYTVEDDAVLLERYKDVEGSLMLPCRGADPLHVMLVMQDEFAKRLGSEYTSQYTMNNILYSEAEMHEFLREIENFKAWKTYNWSDEEKAEHNAKAKEEFVDVLHFLWNVANSIGFTAEDMIKVFVNKNVINHKRQDNNY